MTRFSDRHEGGRALASALLSYAGQEDAIVLGLPRGGVVVAYEVANVLRLPLDVFLVRKLGVPGQEELAMGAIASGGEIVFNREVVRHLDLSSADVSAVLERESRELARREQAFRGDRPPLDVHGKTVLLVDDGLATGSSMRAAIVALQRMSPRRIIVAVPVGAEDTCAALRHQVDEVHCLLTPEPFYGVGMWYEDFSQTSDEEVRELLAEGKRFAKVETKPEANRR